MTKVWAEPSAGWAKLVCVIDCCTGEINRMESFVALAQRRSHRCRRAGGGGALAGGEKIGPSGRDDG